MYGTLSVVNNSRQVISVNIDNEALFCDILPGESTNRKPVLIGTRCAVIINSRGKIAADFPFSVAKNSHTVLKICSKDY